MQVMLYSDYEAIASRMKVLLDFSKPWRGITYRSVSPKYASDENIISGIGSYLHGGRWNPIGVSTVYSSLDPDTSLKETLAQADYYQIPIHKNFPVIHVAIEFDLNKTIDLTEGLNRQRLCVSLTRMNAADWRKDNDNGLQSITQAIGLAAFKAGFEAMLVPSVATENNGINLIYFPENLVSCSKTAVFSDND